MAEPTVAEMIAMKDQVHTAGKLVNNREIRSDGAASWEYIALLTDHDNRVVANVVVGGIGPGISEVEARANAARLVLGWNAHDGLMAACQDLDSIKGRMPCFPGSVFIECARDMARAALAAAKGESPATAEVNR